MEEENIVTLKNPNNGNIVVLTSFDSGTTDEVFAENYKLALTSVITVDEYEAYKDSKVPYTPHALMELENLPDSFSTAVENLNKFIVDETDHTMVIIRGFQELEGGSPIPVEMDLEFGNVSYSDQINAERSRRAKEKTK